MPLARVGDPWVAQSKVFLPVATHCVPCVVSQLPPHSRVRGGWASWSLPAAVVLF